MSNPSPTPASHTPIARATAPPPRSPPGHFAAAGRGAGIWGLITLVLYVAAVCWIWVLMPRAAAAPAPDTASAASSAPQWVQQPVVVAYTKDLYGPRGVSEA